MTLCRISRSIVFKNQLTSHHGNIQGVVIFQSREHSSWKSLCWLSGFKNRRLLLIGWIQRHKYWGKAVTDPLEWGLTGYNNNVFIDRAITKESISFFFFSQVSERKCFLQAADNSVFLPTPCICFPSYINWSMHKLLSIFLALITSWPICHCLLTPMANTSWLPGAWYGNDILFGSAFQPYRH